VDSLVLWARARFVGAQFKNLVQPRKILIFRMDLMITDVLQKEQFLEKGRSTKTVSPLETDNGEGHCVAGSRHRGDRSPARIGDDPKLILVILHTKSIHFSCLFPSDSSDEF